MCNKINVALFDVDGVLTLPTEFFAQKYARERGLGHSHFDRFFGDHFPGARIGKADLKELIASNQEIWQWTGDPDELLEQWFKAEDERNHALLDYIQIVRSRGIACYVATNQERYRGQYIKNVMLTGQFDGYFVSAEMGIEKPDL